MERFVVRRSHRRKGSTSSPRIEEQVVKEWHKSTYSDGGGGNCVEVAEGPVTGIRDTQNRALGYLSAPASEWIALLAAVRVQ
ncbi:DUF397 domain-containing protein [Nocardiopsis dassonvillei]|nr:DUF397 domain-containing protein [Nocardiopsis dassonvillei]